MLPSPPSSAFSFLRPPRNLASQFELTTHTALPDHPTVADLPRAIWRNKRYVLEDPLSPYWACRLCDANGQLEFFAATATSSAPDHLRKSHRIFESSQAADPDLSTDESERPKRRRLQYSTVPRASVKTIRELSLGLLINTDVPFSFFSDTFFQQLDWQLTLTYLTRYYGAGNRWAVCWMTHEVHWETGDSGMESIEVFRDIKYLKYDPGFDLFDLRAALPEAAEERQESERLFKELNEELEPIMREEWELTTGVR
ncbi:hypothetical protein QSH57_004291 [Fusarium oxysporum f. sp. vasinfectum]|nr:hypothetical protein QSH57_004291 [Fusarium oxysporum f. sp. vasinfectum]